MTVLLQQNKTVSCINNISEAYTDVVKYVFLY